MSKVYYSKIVVGSLFLAIFEAMILILALKLVPLHSFYDFKIEVGAKLYLELFVSSFLLTVLTMVITNYFLIPKEVFVFNKLKEHKKYEEGTVKWFNAEKGFGFILRDSGGEIFVHFRAIRGTRDKFLEEGKRVRYSVALNDKGIQAESVSYTA